MDTSQGADDRKAAAPTKKKNKQDMKATVNNIRVEGTPAEIAEFARLTTPKVECNYDWEKEFQKMQDRLGERLSQMLKEQGYGEPTQEQLDWFNDDRNHCSAFDLMPSCVMGGVM